MSYLTKKLPNYVDVGGERIAIETDFRTWIKYEELMLDESQDSEKQVIEVINLCLAEDITITSLDDLEKLFDALLQFYSLGEKIDEGKKRRRRGRRFRL